MELKPVEARERNSEEILRELRAETRDLPGISSLQFEGMQGGPGGKAIEIEISGDDVATLLSVSEFLKGRLRDFDGVYDITDDFDAGRREAQIELLDSARALGLTTESLAMQVRAAFYGLEARKVQRAREDVKIMVRYPESARRQVYDLESMWISTPGGPMVPFTEVARMTEGEGYATIKRKDQKRTVTLEADVDDTVAKAPEIVAELKPDFAQLQEEHPGVTFDLAGRQRELRKAFGSLGQLFVAAILMIYVLLAGLFRSYVQPIIVMTAIPFGLIGAVVGHHVMGYPLTILSLIGLVALTGIVVNDSLILVDFINRSVRDGSDVFEAVVAGGRARIRAILLTSITTILGLAPLLAETSFQARFLIPMGISIAFGLAFATVLTLVVVPALYLIVHDVRRGLAATRGGMLGMANVEERIANSE
jgi:multidrug efflux pump subunit AcrB